MPTGIYKRESLERRFWDKVNKTDYCWEWTAGKHRKGYGYFWAEKIIKLTHRFSWEIHFGKIPKGLCVLHKCDNPPCIRPNHLFLGTLADNNKDRAIKGRNADVNGEKNGRAKLTENNIKAIRDMYVAGNITQVILGRLFGVSQTMIKDIISKKNWKYI